VDESPKRAAQREFDCWRALWDNRHQLLLLHQVAHRVDSLSVL
jgi:hypothetical protein